MAKWCLCFLILCLGLSCPSSKEQVSFNFMSAVTICSDFGAQENKVCHCFLCFTIYLPWSDGTRWYLYSECWVLSQLFISVSLSSRGLISSSSLSAIILVSSAYLRLLIFLLAILIPACASSSPAFHMMYSAYKLNKEGDYIYIYTHISSLLWISFPFRSPQRTE